jgi:hypothetical protein
MQIISFSRRRMKAIGRAGFYLFTPEGLPTPYFYFRNLADNYSSGAREPGKSRRLAPIA